MPESPDLVSEETFFKRKKFKDTARWELRDERYQIRIADLVAFHKSVHKGDNSRASEAFLSVDGVPDSNSGK